MTSYSLSTELHLSSPIYRSSAKKHTAASVCTHTPTYPTPVRRRGDVIGLHIERDGLGMGTPRELKRYRLIETDAFLMTSAARSERGIEICEVGEKR